MNYIELKKLGFKPSRGSKDEMSVDINISKNDFITIHINVNNNDWHFSNIEIESLEGSNFVKENFKNFSNEEIISVLKSK